MQFITVIGGNMSENQNHEIIPHEDLPKENPSPKDLKSRNFRLSRPKNLDLKKTAFVTVLFVAAFMIGRLTASAVNSMEATAVQPSSDGNWGLSFPEKGKTPVGNATIDELKQYDSYYADGTEEKVIYLTFDCGYENGNTATILDALKKHKVTASFFVVGTFVDSNPELIKRMVDEGHIVGNHTYHHPDMSKISTVESFSKELTDVESQYEEITGQPMTKFYRPPQGKYSVENLQMAKDLGYKTFFWSLAYVDWYQDKQPTKEEAFEKLLGRIHPGAIVLLHSTSSTNAAILDELLSKWEEMGYTFKPLTQIGQSAGEEKIL